MEVKKYLKVDTEQKKSTNLLIGLNIALLLTWGLMAFTNKPEVVKKEKSNLLLEAVEEIPPTQQEPPKAPPPPPSPDIQEIEDDSDKEEDPPPDNTAKEQTVITAPVLNGKDDGKGKDKIEIDDNIYSDVDDLAFFGDKGEEQLREFVSTQFKMPRSAQELGISGTIPIMFVVETDGSVTDIKAIAPPNRKLGYGLEEEVIRIMKLTSTKWKPATRMGKPVRSYFRFPFQIDNSTF